MNRRQEQVGYRPLELQPVRQQGLIPINYDDGDLERRVAAGLARIADTFADRAAQEAEYNNTKLGEQAALAGAPTPDTIEGGDVTGTASINGQAGHIVGAEGYTDQKGVRVTVAPPQIRSIITDAAKRNGVDPDTLSEIARLESNYNPGIPNTNSTAGGLFQFIDKSARAYGLKDRYDPAQASDAAARMLRDNAASLKSALGRDPTPGELYLAHQQGPGGAAALLKDPSKRAADVVGAEAVRLNGGTADMTAGEFAKLWTSKVHAGATIGVLPADRDGPVQITPVRTPLKIIPGKPNTFRPSNQNTIAGRAYDVAGTRTWLQLAKQGIVEDQAQLYDRYKDDPATLKASFDQLLEQHKRDGTYFPEVAAEYETTFREHAFQLTRQAVSEQQQWQKAQDKVDFLGRMSSAEDRKNQLLGGLDPKDPQASAMLQDAQSDIDNHYDSAVARRIMTPAEADEAKRNSRSDMAVGYYLKQATGLKTDELTSLHKQMEDDWNAGKLAGVTSADWGKIDAGFQAAIKARETGDKTADAALTSRGDDIFTRMLHGEPMVPSDITRMRADALTAPHGDDILASTDAKMRLANALRTEDVTTVESKLDDILKRPDGHVSADDLAFARTQIDQVRKALAVDPLGVAERFGLVQATPPLVLNQLTDPGKLRDALSFRKGAAEAAAQHFGVPVKYFRPGEAGQIAAQAMQNPDAMTAFTLNAAQAFGNATPQAMREISENGPVMAYAVGTSIATGDPSLARDIAEISGMKARKELDLKIPEAGALGITASKYLAGALRLQPRTQAAATQTANLLFEKMAAEQGFDATDMSEGSPAQAAYFKALDRALGGQVLGNQEFGGIGMVNERMIIVPPLMEKHRPDQLIAGITTEQLQKLPPIGTINGVKIDAERLRNGYLVSIGDGLYNVTMNDPDEQSPDYIIGASGKPWVLDIRQLDKVVGAQGYVPFYRPGRESNQGF